MNVLFFQINQSHQYWNCQKFLTFMLNLIRYMFWCFFTELLLHFIYVNAIQYHLQVIILFVHKVCIYIIHTSIRIYFVSYRFYKI